MKHLKPWIDHPVITMMFLTVAVPTTVSYYKWGRDTIRIVRARRPYMD